MLHLYQSNRLEQLGDLFCAMTRAVPLSNPFQSETVLVQSRGMGRWLSMTLATKNGVAANLEYILPAAYSWRLVQLTLPDQPRLSPFSPDVLTWRLMALLPTLDDPVFAPLVRYAGLGRTACFELAGKIADVFDQYLVFRPDWIRAWERGKRLDLGEDEPWQAELWRRLAEAAPDRHRVRMLDEFLPALGGVALPERITLFGISSLAPMYLALIKRLAEVTDVCVFLLNPCEAYWGDLADPRSAMRKGRVLSEEDEGHPLLASLGKQGRDFFDQIVEELPEFHWLDAVGEPDTLLGRLQRGIRTLTAPEADVRPLAEGDRSIEIHVAHGAMREMEILKDALLGFLADDPTLTPADIAVLTPDINAAAPYIDAVFGAREDAPNLSYSIADRRVEREEPLLAAFLALLELADSRFGAPDVLALLECPAVLRRFGLGADDVPFIHDWVRESGIRWGRDAGHKRELGLPADPIHTWRWGLDRLLLGGVLPESLAGDRSPLFGGLLPDGAAAGSLHALLARFADCLDVLFSMAERFGEPCCAEDWQARLNHLADAVLAPSGEEEAALDTLREALAGLVEETRLAGFTESLPLAVVRDALARRLSVASQSGFLSGGVTFCAMVPMRSIPFRVICLIGMNDGAYPRDERPVSFDLVARHPARGDRSRRFDDRYLFLEALMSARDILYLSYVGLSSRSGETLPPSPLIAELSDVAARMCGAVSPDGRRAFESRIVVRHPLQPFSGLAYDGRDPRLASFDVRYARALALPPRDEAPFSAPLPEPADADSVRLNDLLRFWRMPCRAWLADRLGIRLSAQAVAPPASEPFALDRDGRLRIRETLLDAMVEGRPVRPARDKIRGAGWLPPAALGNAWLDRENDAGRTLAARLPKTLAEAVLPPVMVHRAARHGVPALVGELYGLRPSGLLSVVPRKAFAGEIIEAWLRHLIVCDAAPAGVALFSALYDETTAYRWGPVSNAAEHLDEWLRLWREGQVLPLPLFPRTSLAHARDLAEGGDDATALIAARGEWEPMFDAKRAQKDDAAVALVFRGREPLEDPLFAGLSRCLLVPMWKARLDDGEGEAS
ncbi:exodeoxyribonuclease V subunit gamma [Paludibacterium paludis]|uniref:RecBCD enzyme subunit RecC n=1 Tax=Paludibacterium paludis TaxID=1225769 RepID=A0A918UBR9_9NEIS|nr:exodeoxyribonuclease V subunit gamma [Paludibacterium paludis]GGY27771.1 RecBCD enzyme subunit RecC [Paludibacterium paludis]